MREQRTDVDPPHSPGPPPPSGVTRGGPSPRGGRPRDESIDEAVLAATVRHLGADGFAKMSVAAIAAEAGTDRPAIYRRWPTKLDLALAAVESLAPGPIETPASRGTPFEDLVRELELLRGFAQHIGAAALAGVMLAESAPAALRVQFRQRLSLPRRLRLRGCLDEALAAGLLAPDADLDMAAAIPGGSWLSHALEGRPIARDWPRRTARLIWRACGGDPTERPSD